MEEDGQKRRIVIIGVSSIFLLAMVIAIAVTINLNNDSDNGGDKKHVASTVKAVKTVCKPTYYQKECEKSLRAEAGNTTDPRELIKIAFNVTIKEIGERIKKTDLMHEIENDPRSKMALDTCRQLMDLSMSEFKRSLERMGKFNLNNLSNIINSLRVWLSGAITYQDTCLEGFKNTTGEAGKKMRNLLTTTMHMSSNSLDIITDLAATVGELETNVTTTDNGYRQLIQDSGGEHLIPSWVEDDDAVAVRRLLHGSTRKYKPSVVVAKDGSGNYNSINEALKKVPAKNQKPFVIYIRGGVYNEYVEVTKKMTHVIFVGDGGQNTRITGNKNFADGVNTYRTASVAIEGDYFVAIKMGFENSAGPEKHQAVAIRVQADKAIFYKCSMDGYQDTLYAHAMRQFYRDCTISGTIDFVFGDAVAVFQNCTFMVRKPLENQQCVVTAQGRKERHQPSGTVIQGSYIVSNHSEKFDNKAYLARPWKNHSRTIFMDTYIEELIQPEGYMPWQGPTGLSGIDSCFYAEYNNTGPGSDKSKRVKWRGIITLTSQSVMNYLPYRFFHGDDWIKVTRIPYYNAVTAPKH